MRAEYDGIMKSKLAKLTKSLEKEFQDKLEPMKETYIIEMKSLKDQLVKHRLMIK